MLIPQRTTMGTDQMKKSASDRNVLRKRGMKAWATLRIWYLPSIIAVFLAAVANAAIAAEYRQDFDFPNGTTDLGDGSIIASSTMTGGGPTAQVVGNRLRLTSNQTGSTSASFKIPSLGADATDSFAASFDFELFSGGTPADGFSFNFGAIDDAAAGSEEGFGTGMSIEFDTFDNGGGEFGHNIAVDNADVPNGYNPLVPVADGVTRTAVIRWANNAVTLSVDGEDIFTEVPTPGFSPAATDRFAFAARTGGLFEDLFIDNLVILAPVPMDVGPGDFNSDGAVDLQDYNILLANFLESFPPVESFSMGDNNGDGTVDLTDFSEFRLAFEAANPGSAAVPEPSTMMLTVLGSIVSLLACWRRRGALALA